MSKSVYCPVYGHMEKDLYFEETENTFICSSCNATIIIKEREEEKVLQFVIKDGEKITRNN